LLPWLSQQQTLCRQVTRLRGSTESARLNTGSSSPCRSYLVLLGRSRIHVRYDVLAMAFVRSEVYVSWTDGRSCSSLLPWCPGKATSG
jgi:hypothetical protein